MVTAVVMDISAKINNGLPIMPIINGPNFGQNKDNWNKKCGISVLSSEMYSNYRYCIPHLAATVSGL